MNFFTKDLSSEKNTIENKTFLHHNDFERVFNQNDHK